MFSYQNPVCTSLSCLSFYLTCKFSPFEQLFSRLEPVQDGRFHPRVSACTISLMVVIFTCICAWFQQTRNVGCTTPARINDPPLTPLGSHETSISVGFLSRRSSVSLVFEHERLHLLQVLVLLSPWISSDMAC